MSKRTRLVIGGGMAEIVEERTLKTMPYGEFMENLKSEIPLSTGILAPGTVYTSTHKDNNVYVLEVKPKIQRVTFHSGNAGTIFGKRIKGDNVQFEIAMPFIYYMIQTSANNIISDVGAVATTKPLNDLNDMVYAAPLTNLFDATMMGNHFCTGNVSVSVGKSVRETTTDMVTGMMNSTANADIGMSLPKEVFNALKDIRYLDNSNEFSTLDYSDMIPGNTILLALYLWERMTTSALDALKWEYFALGSFIDSVNAFMNEEKLGGIGWQHS